MQESTRIAVVIPCFNHADVLRRTLENLQHQTFKPSETVVIDDGSTDDPASIVTEFERLMPIRYVRLDANRGAPYARNVGAQTTSAQFILFLDADVGLQPTALEAFASVLREHPEAAYAYSNFFWGTKRFRGRPFDVDALKHRNFIHTTSLMRREAFPGFDETLKKFQDWDLWLTMCERGSKGVWIDRELFRFDEIWAAAGHPHGVFKLKPQDLERLTGAPVADVVQAPAGS